MVNTNPFVNSRTNAIALLNAPSVTFEKHLGGPSGDDPHPDGSPQSIHGGGKGKKASVKVESDKPVTKSITMVTKEGEIKNVVGVTPPKHIARSIETVAQQVADSGYNVDSPQIFIVTAKDHAYSASQFAGKILLREELFDKDGKPTPWGNHVIAHEYLHNRTRKDGKREHDRDYPFDRIEEAAVDLLAMKIHAKSKDWHTEMLAYPQHVGLLIRSFREAGLKPAETWKAIDNLQKVGWYKKFYKANENDPFWIKQANGFLGGVKNPPNAEEAGSELTWLFGESQKVIKSDNPTYSDVRDQIESAVLRNDLKTARKLLNQVPAEMKDQVDWMLGEFSCGGEQVPERAVPARKGMRILPVHSSLFKHCGTCLEDDNYFGAIPERKIKVDWETHGANQMEVVTIRSVGGEARAALWKPLTGERPDLQQAIGGPLCFREEATCLIDRAMGFYLVPVTYTQEVNGMVGAVVHYVHNLGERKDATKYAAKWIERAAVLDFVSGQTDRGDHNWKTHPDDASRPVIFDNGLSCPTKLKKVNSAFISALGDKAISPGVLDAVESLYRNTALWTDLFGSLGDPATTIAVLRVRLLLELGSIPAQLVVAAEMSKAYPKDKCMLCGTATPVKKVTYGEGRAVVWFCQGCYAAWREEHEDEIEDVKDIEQPFEKHLPGKHDQSEHDPTKGGAEETSKGKQGREVPAKVVGKVHPKDKKIVESIQSGGKKGLSTFPNHLLEDLEIEVDLSEERGGHYSAGILTLGLPEGERYTPDKMAYDMNGRPIAGEDWFKWYDKHHQDYPTFSTHGSPEKTPERANIHEVMAHQTAQHEMGHAIQRRLEPKDSSKLNRLLASAKVPSRTVQAYVSYFASREQDDDFVPPKGFGDRVNQEKFAEVIRWKAEGNPQYDKLPKSLQTFVDNVWSGKTKLRSRSGLGKLDEVESVEDIEQLIGKGSREFSESEASAIREAIGADEVDPEQFRIGLGVEWEHVDDPETRVTTSFRDVGKIVWAHLKEHPDYYTRLVEAKL